MAFQGPENPLGTMSHLLQSIVTLRLPPTFTGNSKPSPAPPKLQNETMVFSEHDGALLKPINEREWRHFWAASGQAVLTAGDR